MQIWKDAGHLIRLVLLLAAAIGAFLVVRSAVIPEGFGQYGHFRPGALDDVRAHAVKYAGRAACDSCHSDIAEIRQSGKHALLSCEACHGPLAAHAEDPGIKPQLPQLGALCGRCHESNSARPGGFPQVKAAEHSGGESCNTCHKPHRPKFGG